MRKETKKPMREEKLMIQKRNESCLIFFVFMLLCFKIPSVFAQDMVREVAEELAQSAPMEGLAPVQELALELVQEMEPVAPVQQSAPVESAPAPVAQAPMPQPSTQPLPQNALPTPQVDAVSIKEALNAAEVFNFEEFHKFVRDWISYSRWRKNEGVAYQTLTYLGPQNANNYPVDVVRWMDARGWNTERFFLLETKFKITLKALDEENKQSNFIQVLEDQLKQIESNDAMPASQKKAVKSEMTAKIKSIRQSAETKAPVTQDEYDIIQLNKEALLKVFQ